MGFSTPNIKKTDFPSNFLWGASTASYQIEEDNENSDWSHDPKRRAGKGVMGWSKMFEDIDLTKRLNLNAYRFSLEWARIQPQKGKTDKEALDRYISFIGTLIDRGITPVITLQHYTLPYWVAQEGGWASISTISYFVDYCRLVVSSIPQEYFEKIKIVTLNEPANLCAAIHLWGCFPPYERSLIKYVCSLKHMAEAHNKAYRMIKQMHLQASVGAAVQMVWIDSTLWARPVKWLMDKTFNYWFFDLTKGNHDFVGLNQYQRYVVTWKKLFQVLLHLTSREVDTAKLQAVFVATESEPVTDLGWRIYPPSMKLCLIDVWKRYEIPILITENGVADAKDEHRKKFFNDYLLQVMSAIRSGVKVEGYFHWSLMDNFEWEWGYGPKFGLYSVDKETYERTIRGSAVWFSRFLNGEESLEGEFEL
jgi:beta-glucosidase